MDKNVKCRIKCGQDDTLDLNNVGWEETSSKDTDESYCNERDW